ncbi:MAG: gluconolactonase [Burkholderiales bacterium RIFCSPLOWO2_12_FULL_61_40]|nr:MAG: gluconolactonase [Burkholderiales bacterium RIFCSPLOWO2_12_FULL_61_40]
MSAPALPKQPPPAPVVLGEPRSVWSAQALLGEGGLWSVREQALFWVDILGHQLHRFCPATQARDSWAFNEEISAVAERAQGPGLLVTLRHDLALFNPDTSHLQRLHRPEPAQPGNRFNDGKCDAQGRFWGGTMDFACQATTGALYRYQGGSDCTQMHAGFAVTNGPTWSLDGRTLYFNDTVQGRVHAFDVDPTTGTLGASRLWLQLGPQDGFPDGMTTDAAGRIWIAHWGSACVTCHDPDSALELARITLPTSHITSCAFGGADLRTLYITSACSGLNSQQVLNQPLAGALFCVDIGSPGLPTHRFAG